MPGLSKTTTRRSAFAVARRFSGSDSQLSAVRDPELLQARELGEALRKCSQAVQAPQHDLAQHRRPPIVPEALGQALEEDTVLESRVPSSAGK